MRRLVRPLLWAVAFTAAAAMLFVVVLAIDANWLKHPVERWVGEKTGRELAIDGDLALHLHWPPSVSVENVRFSNPAWAREPEMIRLQRGEISVALLPLLRGRLVLPLVSLNAPQVDLERAPDGAVNWTLAGAAPAPPGPPPALPNIGRLAVDRGVVRFRDPAHDTQLTVEANTDPSRSAELPLRVRASGRYRGEAVDGEGSGGSILSLADTHQPYPLDARARVGPTQASVRGTVTGLAVLAAADLVLDLRGESMSQLFPLLQIAIPPTPPYRIRGHLIREGDWWRLHQFEGHVGDSDLSGDTDVRYANGRTRLLATVESRVLDLNDLAGFIGAPQARGPGETASPRQQQEAAAKAASPKLLPDMPLHLSRLRAMDADVHLTGKSIRGTQAIDDLTTHLVLEHGVLTLQPLDFGIAGGHVVGNLVLDGRADVAGIATDVEARRLDMHRLFPGNDVVARATGIVGGRAKLQGSGNSLAGVLATADGTLGLAMAGGEVSELTQELAGLDVAETLRILFTRHDRPIKVRCAAADASVQHGVLRTSSAVLDTTDTNVKLEGQADLGKESLDFTLHPLPKDYSPVSLRSPLHLKGTFKHLRVRPDRELYERAGLAAILGALAAPLALVALIETGPGDDVDCEHLMAAVQQHTTEAQVATPQPSAGGGG